MTAITDKPRLSRAHALELLKQMIRIHRFEDADWHVPVARRPR